MSNYQLKFILLISISLVLSACGGGSDAVVKIDQQPLIFADASVNFFVDDAPFLNPVTGGSGTGAVQYTSSDESVAQVNSASGLVTIVGAGGATITANKPADATYNRTSASYSVSISKRDQVSLTFAQNATTLYVDQTLITNPLSGGSGSGELTYSTDNPGVATVDKSNGAVSAVAVGTTTISVTKAADAIYNAANSNYTLTVSKYDQVPVVFDQANIQAIIDGPTVINLLSEGSGSGAISYAITDSTIASVDSSTGEVWALSPGSTLVTGIKAEDSLYYSATASYTLDVVELLSNPDILVGPSKTTVEWDGQVGTIDLGRSTDTNCDIDNIGGCENGHLTTISSLAQTPVVDSYISLTTPAYLIFQNEIHRSSPVDTTVVPSPFPRRKGQQMVSFHGKLWVIGGVDDSAGPSGNDVYWYNDIWSSEDGVTWDLEHSNAAFSPRANHQIVEYGGELYLMGGEEGEGTRGALRLKADVWKSSDGVLWQEMSPGAPFGGRKTGRSVVFDNKIWIVGGGAFSGSSSIWSTTNGTDWTEESPFAPFGPREGHALFVVNDLMMVLGGMGPGGSENLLNDVWSSPDGINWTEEAAHVSFAPRVEMHVESLKGTLWLTGGHSFPTTYNSAYSSSDGITWKLAATPIISPMNQYHSLVLHNNALWIYSGLDGNFIWKSNNGTTWGVPVDTSVLWDIRP